MSSRNRLRAGVSESYEDKMRDPSSEQDFEAWPQSRHLNPTDIILDRRLSSISPFSLPKESHHHLHHSQSRTLSHATGHTRHRSVHHEYEFSRPGTPSLLALSMTPPPSPPLAKPKNKGHLTFINGLALVLSLQIGSGIFSTPAIVLSKTAASTPAYPPIASTGPMATLMPNRTLALGIWLLAGILASTGAASFAELGVAVPRNGGVQEYVRHCWGARVGCCAATTLICVVFPSASAMIARIGAGYFGRVLFGDGTGVSHNGQCWAEKGLAVLGIALVTGLNCAGTRTGAKTANMFLFGKILALAIIIVGGFASWTIHGFPRSIASLSPTLRTSSWEPSILSHSGLPLTSSSATDRSHMSLPTTVTAWSTLGRLTDATLAATLTYQGWENLSYVAGELADPARTLPRILYSAMALVVALFSATNLAYFAVVPAFEMMVSDVVALDFGTLLIGRPGTFLFSAIVTFSCLGALNAKIFAVGRLAQAAIKREYMPIFLGSSATRRKMAWLTAPPPPRYEARGLGIDGVGVVVSEGNEEARPLMSVENDADGGAGVGASAARPGMKRVQSNWRNVDYGTGVEKGKEDERPIRAMLLNALLTTLFILLINFRTLVTYAGFSAQSLLLLAVSGLFRHRSRTRRDSRPRIPSIDSDTGFDDEALSPALPYRTNILNPVVFCAVIGVVVLRGALEHPWLIVGMMGLNAVALFLFELFRDS